ncbi:hypothetical protein [Paraliomyxa miuraensis]|uniref:hypothetical protein n=1 Tax=Paraliomyxa miuraensis TaxID=376150 RepID=UPI002251265A|nr:hypothetical protein [Paraliomyxa miuraensis]MCX4239097.1 hypothetical protein [Paraliomyxa miuraensis]
MDTRASPVEHHFEEAITDVEQLEQQRRARTLSTDKKKPKTRSKRKQLATPMSALDLLLRTGIDSERFHQFVLVSLLRHTTLPEFLRPGFGPATNVGWEPHGGTYDLSMTNASGHTVLLELKVDSALSFGQLETQVDALPETAELAYVLLGHCRFTARPRLDDRLSAHLPARAFVHDLASLHDLLAHVQPVSASAEASEAAELATAYRHHLPKLSLRNEGFFDHPPAAWEHEHWGYYYGYFEHCRRTIPAMKGAHISYVPTPTGGFRACHLPRTTVEPGVKAYLQLEDGKLCFKISVNDDTLDRSATRDRIRDRLLPITDALDLPIRKPDRLGHGQTMTLAFLPPDETGFGLREQHDRFARSITIAATAIERLACAPRPTT